MRYNVDKGQRRAARLAGRLSNLIARRERELRESHVVAAAKAPAATLHDRLTARYAPAAKGGAP
jgi:hypothetical protein